MSKENTVRNVYARSLKEMLSRMQKYSTDGARQSEILRDMKKISDGVGSLAILSESRDPGIAPEQWQAGILRGAEKLKRALEPMRGQLSKLKETFAQDSEATFQQHSGLTTTERRRKFGVTFAASRTMGQGGSFFRSAFRSVTMKALARLFLGLPISAGLTPSGTGGLKNRWLFSGCLSL